MRSGLRHMPYVSDESASREIARRLEADNPLWIVVFGIYSKEFVCFPRFTVPGGAIVVAQYPGEVQLRMRHIEHAARDAVAALREG
jgi:hypothetical protein